MSAPMSSELFWSVKPKHLDHLKTTAQEWEFYEREKAGLSRWCQAAAEAKKKNKEKKTLISCRCL